MNDELFVDHTLRNKDEFQLPGNGLRQLYKLGSATGFCKVWDQEVKSFSRECYWWKPT